MKSASAQQGPAPGFTLLEMTIVIMVLLALVGMGFGSSAAYRRWSVARGASETLRTVYTAQRTFLADNPTTPVSSITHNMLSPYLPGNPATFPTVKSLTGSALTIYVGKSPPYLTTTGTSSGALQPPSYDPSGSTTDSLWDVGE